MESKQIINRLVDLLIVAVFSVSLLLPLILWAVQKDEPYSGVEKRELQTFPVVSLQNSFTDFTRAFDSYFQDHFGLREFLIHRYHREASKRFGVTGVPNVVEARDGWLYLSSGFLLDDLKGRLQFSDREKEQFWNQVVRRQKWLKEQGVAYIFLVAPNKQTIYPEYLPHYYQGSGESSRLDQLLVSRPERGAESFLDVRARLTAQKANGRLYHKSDTHWNKWGASFAAAEIFKRTRELFPDFSRWKPLPFAASWNETRGGDLALMIGKLDVIRENRPVIEPAAVTAVTKGVPPSLVGLLTVPQLRPHHTAKSGRPLRVLVLHDSFFENLKPFVSEGYGEVFYLWKYYDDTTRAFFKGDMLKKMVALYQPDLVVEELVERNLPRYLAFPVQE